MKYGNYEADKMNQWMFSRKAALAFVAAALIIVAGCGGGPQSTNTTTKYTTTTAQTVQTETQTLDRSTDTTTSSTPETTPLPTTTSTQRQNDDLSLPPGVTRQRVDENELYQAFVRNTLNTSFTFHLNATLRFTRNNTVIGTQFRSIRYDRDAYLSWRYDSNINTDQIVYSNGSVATERTDPNGTDQFNRSQYARLIPYEPAIRTRTRMGSSGIGFLFNHSRLQHVRTVPRGNSSLTILESTTVIRPDEISEGRFGELQNWTVRMGVRPDGTIVNLTGRAVKGEGTSQGVQEISYRFEKIGNTDVERPGWVETAIETAPVYEVERGERGWFTFTNVRGRTLPEGTILKITFPEGRTGRLALNEPLALGETTYITRNRTTFYLTREEPVDNLPVPWDKVKVTVRTPNPATTILGVDSAPDDFLRDEW